MLTLKAVVRRHGEVDAAAVAAVGEHAEAQRVVAPVLVGDRLPAGVAVEPHAAELVVEARVDVLGVVAVEAAGRVGGAGPMPLAIPATHSARWWMMP